MLVAGWFRQVRRRRIGWLGRGGRLQNRVVRSNRPAGFRTALRENLLRAFNVQLQFSLELAGRIHRWPGRRGVNTRLGRIRRPARLRGDALRRNRELHAAIRANSPAASQESLHIEFVPVGARKSDSHDTIIASLRARSAVSGQRSAVSGQPSAGRHVSFALGEPHYAEAFQQMRSPHSGLRVSATTPLATAKPLNDEIA